MFQNAFKALVPKVESEEFSLDARDFFADRRAGHMSKWLYSTSEFEGDKACGAEAWTRVIDQAKKGSPYYVFQKERDIIQSTLFKAQEIFADDCRLIDLGPGSIDAVQYKVEPFIKIAGTNLKEYTCVDICTATLDGATQEISKAFPFIQVSSLCHDFIQDSFRYGTPKACEVAALFGLTLCNMPIDPRVEKLPEYQLAASLKRLKLHFTAPDSYLMITQDTNQDIDVLRSAYLALEEHYASVLYRIARDLRVVGDYNPENFVMEVDYFPQTQACALCFVVTESMKFIIDDEFFHVNKGDRFYFHNAFKFDTQTFLNAAGKAGFEVVHQQQEEGNPCILHTLKNIQ